MVWIENVQRARLHLGGERKLAQGEVAEVEQSVADWFGDKVRIVSAPSETPEPSGEHVPKRRPGRPRKNERMDF